MESAKPMDIKGSPAIPRRRLGWIALSLLAGLIILGEIAGQSLQRKGWTTYTESVSDVAIDGQGRVWPGTYNGLNVLAPDGSWTTYTTANSGLADDWVRAVALDNQGRAWVGTAESLSMLDPHGSWTAYTVANSGLADESVWDVNIDGQGWIWVGTGSGRLSVLDPEAAINPGFIDSLHFFLHYMAIPALVLLVIVPAEQRRRSRPKEAVAPQPVPQPAAIEAIPLAPGAVLETGPTREIQAPRQQVIARLLETLRQGDPTQHQQALDELEKMGEVEEF